MDKENIKRVDNRPASVYSIIIFAFVFTMCYIFYPQISMYIPFLGEKVTKNTTYTECGIEDMLDAEYIVIATVDSKTKPVLVKNGENSDVRSEVAFTVNKNLKGDIPEKIVLNQWGGSVLVRQGSKSKKYTVTYTDAAEFEKGKTYLLFIDKNYETVNGKFGAIKKGNDGTFKAFSGKTYTESEILLFYRGK